MSAAEELWKKKANWEEQRAQCASVLVRIRRQRQHNVWNFNKIKSSGGFGSVYYKFPHPQALMGVFSEEGLFFFFYAFYTFTSIPGQSARACVPEMW